MAGFTRIAVAPSPALIQTLEEQGAQQFANVLDSVAFRGQVITAANRIINEEFETGGKNNPVGPKKSRNARQNRRHLAGSITVSIKWNRKSLPIDVEVHSSADPGKVGAQEFGTFTKHPGGYTIRAKNTPYLVFGQEGYSGHRPIGKGRTFRINELVNPGQSRPDRSKFRTKAVEVHHPGVRGRHFMQRALDEAIATRF